MWNLAFSLQRNTYLHFTTEFQVNLSQPVPSLFFLHLLLCLPPFPPGRVAKYCDWISVFVGLSFCLHNHMSKLHKIFCTLSGTVTRSSDDNVLPFLWMTLFSHDRAYVLYSEAYGRPTDVSQRQATQRRAEIQCFSFVPSALPSADWHPSAVSLAVHHRVWLWRRKKYLEHEGEVCYPRRTLFQNRTFGDKWNMFYGPTSFLSPSQQCQSLQCNV